MDKQPRIVFLIPIASSRVVADWHLTCSYLQQTLRSIFNSSNGNFCVVVVGHEVPDFELPKDSRFRFISLDHPIPSQTKISYDDKVRDKMTKLAAAWIYTKTMWNPQYVMKVDADDFISSKLVDWLASAKDEAGYYIRRGWLWNLGSRYFIKHTEHFDELCGTCLIIRSDLADRSGPFLNTTDEARRQVFDNRSLVPGAGTTTLLLNDAHQHAEAQFKYLGHQLVTVPFSAAIYRIGNPMSMAKTGLRSQIHSVRYLLGGIRRTKFITGCLRREFMLE